MPRYASLLDPANELFIDENNWIAAIARKPGGGNPEHAFLLVEGVNQFGQIHLARYDLFIDIDEHDKQQFKIVSKIKAASHEDAQSILLSYILNNDAINGNCWSISKKQAEQLHANILDSQQNPGSYNLLGDIASVPKSGDMARTISPEGAEAASETLVTGITKLTNKDVTNMAKSALLTSSGHNCFTWARTMLHSLNDKRIQRDLPRTGEEIFVSVTSRHIVETSEIGTGQTCCVM